MAPAGKVAGFHQEGCDWFCSGGLPSDVIVVVRGVNFHLHKFPLVSKCGKMAHICEESREKALTTRLEEFPGGPDMFLIAVKFCYGMRVELTPRNAAMVYCAADYLEMTGEYGEGNLLPKSEDFFHENILCNWKHCILALQSSDPVMQRAEKLQIITKCLNALSMMACPDPSLFGWPMMMYGSLQGPDGSILWNGINTGTIIRSTESDWWFEDISCLGVVLFERLINTMKSRATRPENLAGAIMYYARKYLPGLGRRQSSKSGETRTVASFSFTPAAVDQKVLIEAIEKLLPEKKGTSFCRFLLDLLRVALILGVSQTCRYALERKVGMQLESATLDGLLIPTYSDSDTLYDTECVERIINHFISSEPRTLAFSPSSLDLGTSLSPEPLQKVAKLIDNYMAEVASDVNLEPLKMRSLAEALPESSRSLHDGLYRALDTYFKAHPCLSVKGKEELCNVIDCQKLSIDARAHASQNERLPVRVILQVLFFEQMQLRTALASCLHVLGTENAPAVSMSTVPTGMAGQIVQRDGLGAIVRENQVLKVDMENMRSRVGELEGELTKMKLEMRRVPKWHSYLRSPCLVAWKIGCKLRPRPADAQRHTVDSTGLTPRTSVEQAHSLFDN